MARQSCHAVYFGMTLVLDFASIKNISPSPQTNSAFWILYAQKIYYENVIYPFGYFIGALFKQLFGYRWYF